MDNHVDERDYKLLEKTKVINSDLRRCSANEKRCYHVRKDHL